MRILMTSHYALPHYGGIEMAVENLCRALAGRGHEVRLLVSNAGVRAAEERRDFEVIRIPAWNHFERYSVPYPLFSPHLLPEVRRLVEWADLVHAHGFLQQPTIAALWLARRAGRPGILTEHSGMVRYRQPHWRILQSLAVHTIGRLSVSMASAVVVIGPHIRELIRRLAGPEKRIVMIPGGINLERFRPASAARKREIRNQLGWDDRPKVLSVGRLVPRKGIDVLLQTLDDRYDVVLCGRGDMPLPERNGLLVYRSPDDDLLLRIYQASDLFVLASHSEGSFPQAAQQAMACGLPVVIFFDPIYREYVSDDVVEFVDPSPDAMRNAVLRLIADEERRANLSTASVRWAETHFGIDAAVSSHVDLYRVVISERVGGAAESHAS